MIRKKKRDNTDHLSLPSNKVIKVKLSRIVRSQFASKIPIIREIASRVSLIVTHTYHLLKLFCINHYLEHKTLPTIDKTFIMIIMKTVSETSRKAGNFKDSNKDIKLKLEQFYDDHYQYLVDEKDKLKYDGLTQMLDYEATNIITSYHNHLQKHFYKFMCRYINLAIDLKGNIMKIRKKCEIDGLGYTEHVNNFRSAVSKLKSDIYQSTDNCDPVFDSFKASFRSNILNNINIKHALYGDSKTKIKSDPFSLLLPLLKMSLVGEDTVRGTLGLDDKDKLFNIINCFPVRKSNIPKYVKLDTVMLIQLFVESDKRFYYMNISNQKELLWHTYFKTGKKTFRKINYHFNGSIITDGYTASVCFELNNADLKPIKNKTVNGDSDKYVTDLSDDDQDRLKLKTLVGIDPGWSDLIFCTNGVTKIIEKESGKMCRKTETFRYSRKQRRKELKTKRYRDILEDDKSNTIIKGSSVKEIETILSKFNSNSCDFDRCKEYIRVKNKINYELKEYYEKDIHRQLKWSIKKLDEFFNQAFLQKIRNGTHI